MGCHRTGYSDGTPRVEIKKYGDAYVRRFLDGIDLLVLDIWVRQGTLWKVAAVQTTTAKK